MNSNGKVYAHYPKLWEDAKVIFSDKELKIKIIDNGIIVPPQKHSFAKYTGGVYDENKKFVAGLIRKDASHVSGWELNKSSWPGDIKVNQSKETVIFGGATATHFGHFILDGLNRMWSCIQDESNKNLRIAYLIMPLRRNYEWMWDFFSLIDIPKERILLVTKPTQFARILVPEESAHTLLSLYTRQYCLPFQRIMNHVGQSFLKKIYLIRGQRRIHGEDYFIKFYQERGFVPIRPETLSVRDQLGMLSGAEEVVCTLGTLSHLALFCKPGTKFTMLTHTDELLQAQALINKASGVHWIIVDVSQNIFYATHWRGIHLIGPNQHWKKYVKEEWGENIEWELNKDDCFEYIKDLCKHYESYPKRFITDMERNDAFSVFLRIFHVMLGREFDKKRFEFEKYSERGIRNRHKKLLDAWKNAVGRPVIEADVHLSSIGWMALQYETAHGDGKHPIEAIKLKFAEEFLPISYAVYTDEYGWGKEVTNGEMAGSVGKSLPISGIYIKVKNREYNRSSIQYRVLGSDGIWSKWVSDGTKIFSESGLVILGIDIRFLTN